jgi:hypothetical protein
MSIPNARRRKVALLQDSILTEIARIEHLFNAADPVPGFAKQLVPNCGCNLVHFFISQKAVNNCNALPGVKAANPRSNPDTAEEIRQLLILNFDCLFISGRVELLPDRRNRRLYPTESPRSPPRRSAGTREATRNER